MNEIRCTFDLAEDLASKLLPILGPRGKKAARKGVKTWDDFLRVLRATDVDLGNEEISLKNFKAFLRIHGEALKKGPGKQSQMNTRGRRKRLP